LAKASRERDDIAAGAAGTSLVAAVLGVVVATGVAAGFGLGAAWLMQSSSPMPPVGNPVRDAGSGHSGEATGLAAESKGTVVMTVPTILTNLAGQRHEWVRVELSVLLPPESANETLAAIIAQDTVAYLKTVAPSQIDGPGGLSQLRGEIEDRVRIRTSGKSRGVLLRTLVIE
jgi:flagellar protein FliL